MKGLGSLVRKFLIKTDSLGNQLWDEILSGGSRDQPVIPCLIHTNDDGFGLIGTATLGVSASPRLFFNKLDSNGTTMWSIRPYLGLSEIIKAEFSYGYSGVQTNDGYTLVGNVDVETTYPNGSHLNSYSYLWLIKTDLVGNILWNRTYSDATPSSIIQTSDGYALAGSTSFNGNDDFMLVKTDSYGNLLWNKTFGGAGNEAAKSIVETSDGGLLLAGSTTSFGAGGYDFYVVKTASTLTSILTVLNSSGGTMYPYPGTYLPSDLGDSAWLIAHPDVDYSFSHFIIDGKVTPAQYIEDDGDYTYYLSMNTSHTVQAIFTRLPVFNPANHHFYEKISGIITWNDANATANSMSYMGLTGHLVTYTSVDEENFVLNNFGGATGTHAYFIGGFQIAGSIEPAGGWQWVTGEPWNYTNWKRGEPNNGYKSNENATIYWDRTGQWNDYPSGLLDFSFLYPPNGFIVEYDNPLTLTTIQSNGGQLYPSPGTYMQPNIEAYMWLIAHPNAGYKFDYFLIDGKITPHQYIEEDGDYTYYLALDTSHSVQAVFSVGSAVPSILTVLNSVGGIMYPSPGNYTPAYLGDGAAWLIAHPNVGYKFNYFLIDGVITSNQYLEEDGDYTYYLSANMSHTVQAIFTPS